ncbi:Myb-like DNA-binding domain [Musa troglodytarum]|uniref:Myb-like DNA-binding domain n=1 Tax=Musa troglodytarum TaxID=320322 RepID=A0A9E7H154_9LILI|nr:Myb-like DNA-binding domain [Musa troglodytarum]
MEVKKRLHEQLEAKMPWCGRQQMTQSILNLLFVNSYTAAATSENRGPRQVSQEDDRGAVTAQRRAGRNIWLWSYCCYRPK